jgi:hypothetical protein
MHGAFFALGTTGIHATHEAAKEDGVKMAVASFVPDGHMSVRELSARLYQLRQEDSNA